MNNDELDLRECDIEVRYLKAIDAFEAIALPAIKAVRMTKPKCVMPHPPRHICWKECCKRGKRWGTRPMVRDVNVRDTLDLRLDREYQALVDGRIMDALMWARR